MGGTGSYIDLESRLTVFKDEHQEFVPPLVAFEREINIAKEGIKKWIAALNIPSVAPIIEAYVSEAPPLGACLPYLVAEEDFSTLPILSELILTIQVHASIIDDTAELATGEQVFVNSIAISTLSYRISNLFNKLEVMGWKLAVHYETKIPTIIEAYQALARLSSSDISPENLLDMYRQRSAFVYSLACDLTSRIIGETEEESQLLSRFGEEIALAYCLLDDINDLCVDIEVGRYSYPICYMRTNQQHNGSKDLFNVIDSITATAKVAVSLSKNSVRYLSSQKKTNKKKYLIWLAKDSIPTKIENKAMEVIERFRGEGVPVQLKNREHII